MKNLQNIQSFFISESDIDSMLTGFEELGINNPKKLAFIEYYVQDEGYIHGELRIIEGYSLFEIVKSFLYEIDEKTFNDMYREARGGGERRLIKLL